MSTSFRPVWLALPITLLACLLALVPSVAEPLPVGNKVALVVGVNDYANRNLNPLLYAERDVTELAAVLTKAGFNVRTLLGSGKGNNAATRANAETALQQLLKGVGRKDTVLLAFSGHGQQLFVEEAAPDGKLVKKEVPFFCPQDAVPADPATLISLNSVLRTLDERGGGSNLVLVDACRNVVDTNKGARGGVNGKRIDNLGEGTAVFFSCSGRQKARETDKAGGGHGVFFHFVLEGLKGGAKNNKGVVTWERLVPYVKDRVKEEFPGWFAGLPEDELQQPYTIASLTSDPVLVPAEVTPPDGKTYVSKATGMKFVRIRAGTFQMGSPKEETDRSDDETQHEVTLTKDFYLGIHEVTRGQFRKFVEAAEYKTEAETDGEGGWGYDADAGKLEGRKPKYTWRSTGFPQTDEHPVVNVTWNDAKKFAEWLSQEDGQTYRLPTEAEWEYSCRGGASSKYHSGNNEADLEGYANILDQKARSVKGFSQDLSFAKFDDGYAFTAPGGQFKANQFGLYDMHGNVWEWCSDWYGKYPEGRVTDPTGPKEGSHRVIRGGCWYSSAGGCRAAIRDGSVPGHRIINLGFRLARVPSSKK